MEILYKAKRKDTREWVEGFPFLCEQGKVHEIYYWKSVLICEETNTHEPKLVTVQVIPETVCRYIGKEDKNRNNVFEGDVYENKYTVTQRNIDLGYYLKGDGLEDLYIDMVDSLTRTGNIHDKKD